MRLQRISLESKKSLEYTTRYFPLNNLLSHENIEKAIHLAFDHAYTLPSALDLQVALKKNNYVASSKFICAESIQTRNNPVPV